MSIWRGRGCIGSGRGRAIERATNVTRVEVRRSGAIGAKWPEGPVVVDHKSKEELQWMEH